MVAGERICRSRVPIFYVATARWGGLGCAPGTACPAWGRGAALYARLVARSLPAWAGGRAGLAASIRFGFSCLAHFVGRQNVPNFMRPQPRKNYFIIGGAWKIFRR